MITYGRKNKLGWELWGLWWWLTGDNFGRYVYREWRKQSEIFKKWDNIETLEKQDHPTLARWWHELNCWRWPEGLAHPITGDFGQTDGRRGKLMDWIEERVPRETIRENKTCSHER